MVSVRRSKTVLTETVSKEINIDHNNLNRLKNINCINNHLKYKSDKNSCCCAIDKTIKRILPISVDTSTILSPSALNAAQNSAQNSNKYLLTNLNNFRKPPTIQVRCLSRSSSFYYYNEKFSLIISVIALESSISREIVQFCAIKKPFHACCTLICIFHSLYRSLLFYFWYFH
jgi:hypothetical protein